MRRSSLLTGLATAGAALALVAGCGGSGGTTGSGSASGSGSQATVATSPATSPSVAATGTPTLRISGFSFGSPLTVRPGQKVAVVNADGAPHTVTADRGGFDVTVAGSSSATLTAPTKPGSYPFHCAIHPQMHGTLIVR
ncbi:MAG TPA: cupredoxin domain-containing protein [Mycobacteriales bacterium]|nr:cupredoxin domain-containing protein [Mycobacteriales bacterium]